MDPHSDDPNGDLVAKRRRQHLYLVFDDWSRGLSIRKIDLFYFDYNIEDDFPEPFVRIEVDYQFSQYITAAFGSKIIIMPASIKGSGSLSIGQIGQPVLIDVNSQGLTFSTRPSMDLVNPISIPVRGKLFVLSSNSFQVLIPPMAPVTLPSWKGSWHQLPLQPFRDSYITSYAVHPDGTIFVSTKKFATKSPATYTFDTKNLNSLWKKQGDWGLPFTGPAHYDSNMNSWIGIGGLESFRYICACKVVSSKGDGVMCPLTKVCKDELFTFDSDEWHIGANLVSMGSGSFCLVECISVNGMHRSFDPPPLCVSCMFRLVLFSLKYDENGELTSGDCRVRYYDVPQTTFGNTLAKPVAFWL